MQRLSVQLTVALADLADVDADTDSHLAVRVRGVVLLERMLDAHGALDSVHR